MCIRDSPMTSNHTRNPGTPLDLDWVMGAHVNKSAVERRTCLLYTSDAADERSSVDLGGRRIIKKKKK